MRLRCQDMTSGPTSAADITPPHGSSPPLGVPSRSESPAVTEGDASSPFILRQALRTNTHAHSAHRFSSPTGQLFFLNKSVMMTEESRGKRRKQANPRRNRGKKRAERWKVFLSWCKMMQADVAATDRSSHAYRVYFSCTW